MKETIAQDVEKLPVTDIGVLIELYKNDKQFRKFLANIFLEKLYKGESISGSELVKVVINSLDLPDYRAEIIDFLLNSE
jgi:hypothetical protein